MRSIWLSFLVACTQPNPLVCDGGDCGAPACSARTCADFAGDCGIFPDGCGAVVSCGCALGLSCMSGICKIVPGCTPAVCGQSCGSFDDGCGGSLECSCGAGASCVSGQCVGCVPVGCGAGECGQKSNGCGTVIDCGACATQGWTAIGSFSEEMRRVFATPAAGLWIADVNGNVYHSNDDSQFETQHVQAHLSEVFALDGDVWVAGSDGISHKGAADSGFTVAPTSPKNTGGLHGVPGRVFAVTSDGVSGTMAISSDGLAWSSITPSPAPPLLFAVYAATTTEAFAVGAGGAIFHTTDASHWLKQTSGVSVDLAAVWGTGALLLASGRGGTILRSTNQGVSWTKIVSGTSSDLFGLWGSSASDIWASGANATVLHSSDGGVSWTRESGLPVASSVVLFSVFAGGGKVYAVGQNGAVLVRPAP
jgi:hypothetical protein